MREVYVEGHDVTLRFPESTSQRTILETIKRDYPEPIDRLANRLGDPSTDSSSVTFEDFKRLRKEKPEASWGELGGMAISALAETPKQFATIISEGLKETAKGDLARAGKSAIEGGGRGTYDIATLTAKIVDEIGRKIDKRGGTTEDELHDQFKQFLLVKDLEHYRHKAANGEITMAEVIGIKKEDINPELAEAFSYVIDPTVFVGFGSGSIAKGISKSMAKPVAMAGKAADMGASGLRATGRGIEAAAKKATSAIDDVTGGMGKYAVPGGAGAAAATMGLGPVLGIGGLAAGAVPALELTGGALRGFAESMALNPTRTGGLARLAMETPDTLAGKMAGKLKALDTLIEYAGRTAAGTASGAAVGAGLGYLAGGAEGAAQGLGAGVAGGAFGGAAGRFAEGVTGNALRRAEDGDYGRFRASVDEDTGNFLDRLNRHQRIQAMDLVQVANGMAGGDTVRVLSGAQFRKRFGEQAGAQVVEGDRPVVYINGKSGDMRTLAHETFHAIARLDGFDAMALKIKDRLAALHGEDAIGQFTNEYLQRLDSDARTKFAQMDEVAKRDATLEELGAEYFANFLAGKQSSFMLKGGRGPVGALVDSIAKKFAAAKLDRLAGSFDSPIFDSAIKKSKALDMAMTDLAAARRRAHRAVELSSDTPSKVIGVDELGDDAKFNELVSLGLAKTDRRGRRVLTPKGEEKKAAAEVTGAVARAIESTGDTGGLVKQPDGSFKGKFSPEQIDAVLGAADIPDKVKEVVRFLKSNFEGGKPANVTYAAATFKTKSGKTRYKNLPFSNRDVVPYEIIVSPKTGTMRAKILDLSFLRSKATRKFLDSPRLQQEFGTVENYVQAAYAYINALQTGAKPSAEIVGGPTKRNLLNKLLGIRGVAGNPEIPEGAKSIGADHPWRDFRLDRVVSMRQLDGEPIKFSEEAYQRGKVNFSPAKKLASKGGVIWESPSGHRAVRTSDRAMIRVYTKGGRRIGPLFKTIEKAQEWVSKSAS